MSAFGGKADLARLVALSPFVAESGGRVFRQAFTRQQGIEELFEAVSLQRVRLLAYHGYSRPS